MKRWGLAIRGVRPQSVYISMADKMNQWRLYLRFVVAFTMMASVSSCVSAIHGEPNIKVKPELQEKDYITYDGDRLGYNKWLKKEAKPETVIIGVHGISGHSDDYDNLAKFLQKKSPSVAFYAAETRGQGLDPKVERRGDIRDAKEWYKDLYTFTDLVRKNHPDANIIWFGESMGSLIIMNAYTQTPPGFKKPDAMILSSPIVGLQEKVAPWKITAAKGANFLMPTLKISLESLSNGEKAQVTQADVHEEQAAKNEWYIRRYTLRLLVTLGGLTEKMPAQARLLDCPVLVMHGGKDIFTEEQDVKKFYENFPENLNKERRFYPNAYHLLMYDDNREKIFADAAEWIKNL